MRLSTATIMANTEIRAGVHLIELHAPYLVQAAQPGQYGMVRCCDALASDPLLRRPFFIHTVQRAHEQCTLLVAARGRGSSWLVKQPPGATLDLLGPFGHGWEVRPNVRNLLLISAGEMIGALTFLAQWAIEQELAVTLLAQYANIEDIYPPALLSPEIEYHVTLSDNGADKIVEVAGNYLAWADAVCCAVSHETLETLYSRYERLRQKHIAQGLVVRPLVCASGVCLTCAMETRSGPKLTCRDGPVFEIGEIV